RVLFRSDKLGPGNATSIPLPLMILAGVALLLVAAAGASDAARKIQARHAHPATVPPTPPTRRKWRPPALLSPSGSGTTLLVPVTGPTTANLGGKRQWRAQSSRFRQQRR